MQRFAFKIDKALKANLYKICRLCGIEYPEMVPILKASLAPDEVIDVDEPELQKKIFDCIGFEICKDDKMPQRICSNCVEKIDDFYEFREMCYSTDVQTRKLLGLKNETPKKVEKRGRKRKGEELDTMPEVKLEYDAMGNPRKNLRLSVENPVDQWLKPKEEIKEELKVQLPVILPPPLSKFKNPCHICGEGYPTKKKLEKHEKQQHIPCVKRFHCFRCNETLKKGEDIRNHQMWHKVSKTSFLCPICDGILITYNALTRHVKDHNRDLATPVTVLDRECPQCHQTFVTNFLYNTHNCAVKTHKCGGCNRVQRSDADYLRHAISCPQAYLNASTHISLAPDTNVRIKNENDVEAANEIFDYNGMLPLELMPVVTMTQCSTLGASSSEMDIDNNNKTAKKCKKSKELKKRVNDLLKSTRDALVSIKHEPEIHVGLDPPAQPPLEANPNHSSIEENANTTETQDHESDYEQSHFDDDHHGGDDSDDDGDVNNHEAATERAAQGSIQCMPGIKIKQEKLDDYENRGVRIKSEPKDADDPEAASTKVPVLKLKIVKEHGTLNSSIVKDGLNNSEKKKKKKKRKDLEKEKTTETNESAAENEISSNSPMAKSAANNPGQVNMPMPGIIHIKQERLDESDVAENDFRTNNNDIASNAMTLIPMMQLQIVGVSSGVSMETPAEGNNLQEHQEETVEDIKPNREELNRLMKITNVCEDVNMQEVHGIETTNETSTVSSSRSKSRVMAKESSSVRPSKQQQMNTSTSKKDLQIASIVSGVEAVKACQPIIKSEPCDSGYDQMEGLDTSETYGDESSMANGDTTGDNFEDEENAYIKTIDFNNLRIKQEKDLEIVDTYDDYSSESDDSSEPDDETGFQSEEEEREYRELDLPDLEDIQEEKTEGEDLNQNASTNNESDTPGSEVSLPSTLLENPSSSSKSKIPVKESDDNSDSCKNRVEEDKTIEVSIEQPNENELGVKACNGDKDAEEKKCSDRDSHEENEIDEEQENLLNQRRISNATSTATVEEASLNPSSCNSPPTSTTNSDFNKPTHFNTEETDNIKNENKCALVQKNQRRSQDSSSQSHLSLNDGNINEIAENNNNANLERELQAETASSCNPPASGNETSNPVPTSTEASNSPSIEANNSNSTAIPTSNNNSSFSSNTGTQEASTITKSDADIT